MNLEVCTLLAIALTTQELQILDGACTTQSYWDDVVILQVEASTALPTLAAITREHCTTHLQRDRLTTLPRPLLGIEQHMCPVEPLLGLPFTGTDQRKDILVFVAA